MIHKPDIRTMRKPFIVKLGFSKLIDQLEHSASGKGIQADISSSVLSRLKDKDALYDGFEEASDYKDHKEDIQTLLGSLFSESLTKNEIKVALAPMSSEILYATERFSSIFGDKKEIEQREFGSVDEDSIYIMMCSFILASYYRKPVSSGVPSMYDVFDSRGIIKYYKSLYNADFISITPVGKAPEISDELLKKLKNSYDDLSLWIELFPPGSWEVSGFGLKSFVHVSGEESLSRIKDLLILDSSIVKTTEFHSKMDSYMSTLLDVPYVKSSFIMFDESSQQFIKTKEEDTSFALFNLMACDKTNMMCTSGLEKIFNQREDFIVPDVEILPDQKYDVNLYKNLKAQNVKSYIMTPLYDGDRLLGVIELASPTPCSFNKTHIYKIENMKGLCINAIKRFMNERENHLTSLIQQEFTSIHPSVEWRFREEAEKKLLSEQFENNYEMSKITFQNLTALFGQIDISGSSHARNQAIAADLQAQMDMVNSIVVMVGEKVNMPLLDNILYQISIINEKLASDLAAGMEQEVIEFLRLTINPLFQELAHRNEEFKTAIDTYFEQIGEGLEVVYDKRKNYDNTVKMINLHLASRMDKEQESAQAIYPHFFERYKTDGVEHNMYIGQEITPNLPYSKLYLDNLRLWQLKTMCQLEIEHHNRLDQMPVQLKVASLIMVYSNPLAIRYRMDEKQFDIDGAYNARYEIIKKRIDKAHIKGTSERITQPGKIVIIYTQPHDLEEYLNFINYLSYEGFIKGEPELFEIEDLQGVIGLKGLRVDVNFDYDGDEVSTKAEKTEDDTPEEVTV